ncbi:MAG: hypothetical protein IKE81_09150 [Clostridia bacterium]|nr:hypothetical protein [Clostridia bacterium]
MNANGKDVSREVRTETRISAERAETKPKYTATARELLERCREFYEDEENEKAFREWKAEQAKKGA